MRELGSSFLFLFLFLFSHLHKMATAPPTTAAPITPKLRAPRPLAAPVLEVAAAAAEAELVLVGQLATVGRFETFTAAQIPRAYVNAPAKPQRKLVFKFSSSGGGWVGGRPGTRTILVFFATSLTDAAADAFDEGAGCADAFGLEVAIGGEGVDGAGLL
jgi:hypothetical protein